jgi:tRNA/rRNA methyltransferase
MIEERSAAGQSPVFILVQPQMGENIGACARVMGNFAIPDLRIVAPRDGWPNEKAVALAAGSPVLEDVRLFRTVAEAVADCHVLYASTGTPRNMVKPTVTARQACSKARAEIAAGQRVGILFGAEKSGLDNADITRADAVLALPVDPEFSSLNLAMACGVIAHEWRAGQGPPEGFKPVEDRATQAELDGLYQHFHDELDRAGFFYPPEKTPLMMQNLINLFARASATVQEVRTMRGVIKALAIGRGKARVER